MKKTFCDYCEKEIHSERVTVTFNWKPGEECSEDYHLECYLIVANKNKRLRDLALKTKLGEEG